MNDTQLISETAEFIKQRLLGEGSGHDWWHVYRVWQLAKTIADNEPNADRLTVELGAILHDIADWKFAGGDTEAGPKAARQWLEGKSVDEKVISHIEDIIRDTSFKGANVDLNLKTIEAKIVSDADKLDAIGAIGIGRTFAYGGSKGRSMYEPDQKPTMHDSFEAYKKSDSPTINHFYEKLLLLKDLMYTKTGKRLARHRHKIMEQYLDEFFKEWHGEV
jgi:uncharacterized protein